MTLNGIDVTALAPVIDAPDRQPVRAGSPLAGPLVEMWQCLRQVQHERDAYRELLLLALTQLHDRHRRLEVQQRRIVALVDEIRRYTRHQVEAA